MPTSILYLFIMLTIIIIWFTIVKRPIYEAILVSFIALLMITGNISNVFEYINEGLSSSLIYSMVSFGLMSILLTKTKIIDSCIYIILSIVGKLRGGAGYASVMASAFMGALSGSGPGNIMATGIITIPAMKKAGFPSELAANIESNASYLGNMIPPSSNIVAALGALTAAIPTLNITTGQFWIVLWGISIYFIAQRLLMVYLFCKYYKVKPMDKKDIPSLKEALKNGWRGAALPIIILLPFLLDYMFKDTFFTERLGVEGANYLSKSMLLFVGGITSLYVCIINKDRKIVKIGAIAEYFANAVKTISPTIGVCIFGYMIGALFADLNLANELGDVILAFNFGKFWTVVSVCIIALLLGMVVPGSSITVIFGPIFISTLSSVGVDPILAAAMLPCICGVMCGITPPLGLGMYAGMTLAESDFKKTLYNNLWWVAAQFILQLVVMLGCVPIIGL